MGRQTISFVATDELAEWLDEEANRRMTTVSSAAQQLLVEKYREQQEEDGADGSKGGSARTDGSGGVFDRHEDAWYHPESKKYEYAVYDPDERRRYYKTQEGAAEAIERWHVE